MFGFLNKEANTLLGLDISSTSVKLLELSRSGDRYRVENYSLEPLPEHAVVEKHIQDVASVGQAIQCLMVSTKTKARHVAVAVAGSAVMTKTLEMPAILNVYEMETQVEFEANRHIPYPQDEVLLDFEVRGLTPRSRAHVEVLLAVCRKASVRVRETALKLGGLKAKVVDIETHCVQRACGFIRQQLASKGNVEGDRGEIIAIVDIGATITTLSVLTGSKISYTREQLFGSKQLTKEVQRRYHLSNEQAGLAIRQGDLPDDYETEVLQPFKQSVLQQVVGSLQVFYSSHPHGAVDHIILAGGTASIAGLADMVSAKLSTPTTIANPFAGMSISPQVDKAKLMHDAPALMIACGLAMRSFTA